MSPDISGKCMIQVALGRVEPRGVWQASRSGSASVVAPVGQSDFALAERPYVQDAKQPEEPSARDKPVPMYLARHRDRRSRVEDPSVLRSRRCSGRIGTVAYVQNRRDAYLGKPLVRPNRELEMDRVLEP